MSSKQRGEDPKVTISEPSSSFRQEWRDYFGADASDQANGLRLTTAIVLHQRALAYKPTLVEDSTFRCDEKIPLGSALGSALQVALLSLPTLAASLYAGLGKYDNFDNDVFNRSQFFTETQSQLIFTAALFLGSVVWAFMSVLIINGLKALRTAGVGCIQLMLGILGGLNLFVSSIFPFFVASAEADPAVLDLPLPNNWTLDELTQDYTAVGLYTFFALMASFSIAQRAKHSPCAKRRHNVERSEDAIQKYQSHQFNLGGLALSTAVATASVLALGGIQDNVPAPYYHTLRAFFVLANANLVPEASAIAGLLFSWIGRCCRGEKSQDSAKVMIGKNIGKILGFIGQVCSKMLNAFGFLGLCFGMLMLDSYAGGIGFVELCDTLCPILATLFCLLNYSEHGLGMGYETERVVNPTLRRVRTTGNPLTHSLIDEKVDNTNAPLSPSSTGSDEA